MTFLWRFKPLLSAGVLMILSLCLSFIFENIGLGSLLITLRTVFLGAE